MRFSIRFFEMFNLLRLKPKKALVYLAFSAIMHLPRTYSAERAEAILNNCTHVPLAIIGISMNICP